ncbi:hypothetical protein SAMN04488118_11762 [Epibacterium ulvae]|uniref:Uncharacterized protein n=1 Tax=Epibacterium ulvae TaxID=1156985 RepID=A0A1G5RHU3_9RHOB|nr:hypothetical protein SAMN04488118_11762 [Epibacterium ulvae]
MNYRIEKLQDDIRRFKKARVVFATGALLSVILIFLCTVADFFDVGTGPHTLQIFVLMGVIVGTVAKAITYRDELNSAHRELAKLC